MAALLGEELLGAEAAGGEALGAEAGEFQYSGGGIGGANYGGIDGEGIGFEGFGTPEGYVSDYRPPVTRPGSEEPASSSAFRSDKKPQGFNFGPIYNADFVVGKAGQSIGQIISTINNVYGIYRSNKKLNQQSAHNTKNRYRAGIVFQGKESRDQLVRSNRMPAYYSTSNIKSLLRRGIMPFGWNSEMAVEQGFGQEVYAQEMKALTERRSKDFLRREKEKTKLQHSLGDLKNLRERFKTRKLLEYYNQN